MKATEKPVFEVRNLSKDEQQVMIRQGAWKEECPVPLSRLKLVQASYWRLENDKGTWRFQGEQKHDGQIVVLDAAAHHVRAIFKKLYDIQFPIHKICPIEAYDGDDDASMADNNSAAFNCREITGGSLPSLHSYGLAVDINPVQNPYYAILEEKDIQGSGNTKVLPPWGRDYMNRCNLRLGMIENAKESVIEIFKNHGFPVWGGKWNTPIDWQHFQTHRSTAQLLAAMNPKDAFIFFEMYVKNSDLFGSIDFKNNDFAGLYKNNPEKFMDALKEGFLKLDFRVVESIG